MTLTPIISRRLVRVLLLTPIFAAGGLGADTPRSHLYRVTTETGMPHLEENLRNLTTLDTRCVQKQELFTAFPVLDYAALRGCRLKLDRENEELVSYALVCDGAQQTTGRAVWSGNAERFAGTLQVKLGGKNMTFSQHITAVRLGECATASK